MLTVPLGALPGMYKHFELEYHAFVGLYIINFSAKQRKFTLVCYYNIIYLLQPPK